MYGLRLILAIAVILAPAAAVAQGTGTASTGCRLAAVVAVPANTELRSTASGGKVIARFTGALVPLRLTGLAGDPHQRPVRVATSTGKGHVRLEGWMPLSAVETYAARDLPVAGRHVWITASQRVRIVRAGPRSLTVHYAIPGARSGRARATVPCDGISLRPPKLAPTRIPDRARKYQMRQSRLDLYDAPRGDVVFSFDMEDDARQVFWSTESRAGFVHVVSRGGLTIDGWARRRELVPLKRSEFIMQDVPHVWQRQPRTLSMQDAPALVTASRDLPIYARPAQGAAAIGVVEQGAKVYPMERSAGWVNVYPKSLALMPPDGGGFWVRSQDLGD